MSSTVQRALVFFAAALLGAALALHTDRTERRMQTELATLRTALSAESKARLALAEAMQGAQDGPPSPSSTLHGRSSQAEWPPVDAAMKLAGERPEAPARPDLRDALLQKIAQRQPHHFDESRLLELGLTQFEVRSLRDAFESARVDMLNEAQEARLSRDRERGRSARRDVRAALREVLGDARYDLVLYAANFPNRVRVGEVLPGSAAEAAGFRGSDVIVSYDGARVFRGQELYTAMAQRERGKDVALSVERDGQVIELRLPTGALGMTLRPTIEKPALP
jgi:hypothetical protein